MKPDKKKINAIIHTASLTAAGIGAGLAQLPGSDMPALAALQAAMIVAIGHEHGREITKTHAKGDQGVVIYFSIALHDFL
ncbi:MAG: hypothetical protein LC633_09170 [Desulfobulbaceae bacterium]|nr:hypothetical protein [Desulfobulbaceae bacterium]